MKQETNRKLKKLSICKLCFHWILQHVKKKIDICRFYVHWANGERSGGENKNEMSFLESKKPGRCKWVNKYKWETLSTRKMGRAWTSNIQRTHSPTKHCFGPIENLPILPCERFSYTFSIFTNSNFFDDKKSHLIGTFVLSAVRARRFHATSNTHHTRRNEFYGSQYGRLIALVDSLIVISRRQMMTNFFNCYSTVCFIDHLTGECVCVCAHVTRNDILSVQLSIVSNFEKTFQFSFGVCWAIANLTMCSVQKCMDIFSAIFCFVIMFFFLSFDFRHSIWNWNPFNRSRSAVLHT